MRIKELRINPLTAKTIESVTKKSTRIPAQNKMKNWFFAIFWIINGILLIGGLFV